MSIKTRLEKLEGLKVFFKDQEGVYDFSHMTDRELQGELARDFYKEPDKYVRDPHVIADIQSMSLDEFVQKVENMTFDELSDYIRLTEEEMSKQLSK
jgi:hypothetical protein